MLNIRLAAAQILRILPSSRSKGLARHWRDLAKLHDADVAFVSFPKSGRTFVRVMLARLYQRQFGIDERTVLKFDTLRRASPRVPRLLFTHDGDALRTPREISVDCQAYAATKVILLVRHPGDVIVSRYSHLKNRSHDRARQRLAAQPLDGFVWTANGGVPSIVRFLNAWSEEARRREDVLIVRYEDVLADPVAVMSLMADFVGLDSDPLAINDAVEFARLENLRKKEREGYFHSGRLGKGRAGNEESYKVRSGTAGGYRSKLCAENVAKIDAHLAEELDPILGY